MKTKSYMRLLALFASFILLSGGFSIAFVYQGDDRIAGKVDEGAISGKADPIENMKKNWGVRQPGKDYSRFVNGHATGFAPPTEEQYDRIRQSYHKTADGVYTVGNTDPVVNEGNTLTSGGGEALKAPSSYNMTTKPYMPPIADQGGAGSCCAFSATYYSLSILMAQNYSYDINTFGQEVIFPGGSPIHANHIMSPGWSYNMVNSGEDSGSNWFGLWDLSNTVGNSAWAYQVYDDTDITSWGNETAWRNAPKYRTTSYTWMNRSEASDPIETMKTWISNGYALGIGIDADAYPEDLFGWQDDQVISTDDWGNEEYINHANTIIGYNDDKTDPDGSAETGAFLIANTWGDWGPYQGKHMTGTYWMTYDCFMTLMHDYVYKVNDAKYGPSSEPKMLGTVNFSQTGDRDPALYMGIAEEDGGAEPNEHVNDTRKPKWDGASATKNSYPPFIAMDLTEFYQDWDGGDGANYFDFHLDESGGDASTIDNWTVEDWSNGYGFGSGATPNRTSLVSPDAPASNPTTMWTTFTISDGNIKWNQTKYAADDTTTITVTDGDLKGESSISVSVSSDSGDSETFSLDVDERYPHIFLNDSISVSSAGVNTGDGVLQVSGGDNITATYSDASHGEKTDTAVIDTDAPVISNITVTTKIGARIEWDTDEPADSRVNYGTTEAMAETVYDSKDVTHHSVCIDELCSSTTHYYDVITENEAGYTTNSSTKQFTSGDFDDVEAGWVNWTQTPQGANSAERWNIWRDVAQDNQSYNIGNGDYGNKWSDNLTTPIVNCSESGSGEFYFWHEYSMEKNWDGGVVDIRTNGDTWERITASEWDTSTSGGGYDGVIEDNQASSIGDGNHEAFTGSSSGWVKERLDISSYLPAETIQLKFWFCSDRITTDEGWNIDDVTLNLYYPCYPPDITIDYPNAGETFDYGTTETINWTTTEGSGSITGVDLHYSTDGGSSWKAIVNGTPDDGSYDWEVPMVYGGSSECLVKGIVHTDDGLSDSDESDDYFTILGDYEVHYIGNLTANGSSNGWNFVSFNLKANGTHYASTNNLIEILEDAQYGIPGNYSKAMYYDATNDEWRSYMPGRETFNDLETWNRTMGVWIRMTSKDTLQVEGTPQSSTDITLQPGWNMVGYPSATERSANDTLPAEVSKIGVFNESEEYNLAYATTGAEVDAVTLTPGEGYWLYADEATTWTVEY